MCTASWSVGSGRAVLVFNRDERKDRPRAVPPEVFERSGVKRLAAIDPQSSGTWLAANEFGLCSFLLNNYDATESAPKAVNPSSRGELPMWLTQAKNVSQGRDLLEGLDCSHYCPFHIGLLSVDEIALFSWNGEQLCERESSFGMLTTSSFRSKEVQSYREKRYVDTIAELETPSFDQLRNFHVELFNPDVAFNPFMLREESETHNVSIVKICRDELVFNYEERVTENFELLAPKLSYLSIRK